jgi:hypothetical protein
MSLDLDKPQLVDPSIKRKIAKLLDKPKPDYWAPTKGFFQTFYDDYIKEHFSLFVVIVLIIIFLLYRYRMIQNEKSKNKNKPALVPVLKIPPKITEPMAAVEPTSPILPVEQPPTAPQMLAPMTPQMIQQKFLLGDNYADLNRFNSNSNSYSNANSNSSYQVDVNYYPGIQSQLSMMPMLKEAFMPQSTTVPAAYNDLMDPHDTRRDDTPNRIPEYKPYPLFPFTR